MKLTFDATPIDHKPDSTEHAYRVMNMVQVNIDRADEWKVFYLISRAGYAYKNCAVRGRKLVFDNLPAGQYTISEIEAPDGYELSKPSFRSISLTWGQTASTAFYDKPKTRLEVIKVDGITNAKLAGAVFRLTDPTTGEFWEGETAADGRILLGAGDGSRGHQLESETTYILTEIQAPPGYVLDPAPCEVVLGANNIPNSLTFANFKKPTLTVIKYDELTNQPLAGASFRLWKTEGETWSETQITGADGKITWTDLDPGIYSIQEIDEPYGYFKDPARKEILLKPGDNKTLEFFNRPRPILTILKRDAITGQPLADVKFKVQKLEGLTIGEFLTDANGRIELSPRTGYLLDEAIYRVTEVLPPNEYLLSANPQKDVLLKWYEPTELVFEKGEWPNASLNKIKETERNVTIGVGLAILKLGQPESVVRLNENSHNGFQRLEASRETSAPTAQQRYKVS